MASGDIPCFGDSCQRGVEFCDQPSRFCIACSNPPWKSYCFTSKHIENCTEYCRRALELANKPLALELPNRPQNEPEGDEQHLWPIVVIGVLLLIIITVALWIFKRKYWTRIRTKFPFFVADDGNNQDVPENTDIHDVEAVVVLMEYPEPDPVDPRPIQVSEEEAATGSKDYPTFGPTALENHEETKLI